MIEMPQRKYNPSSIPCYGSC